MLSVDHLTKAFGGIKAVDDVSFDVPENTVLGIIGPNGAGKTTLLNLVSGLSRPDTGSICFGGKAVTGMRPYEIARIGLGRTFQNLRLIRQLTVWENVELAVCCRVEYRFFDALLGRARIRKADEFIAAAARDALKVTELVEVARRRVSELPYGVQKRVEIARALALDPKVLLLDEPAAGLNPVECQELTEYIRAVRRARPISVILVEHHVDMVMQLCDEIIVLNFGKCIAKGRPEAVQNDPEVLRAYLGDQGGAKSANR